MESTSAEASTTYPFGTGISAESERTTVFLVSSDSTTSSTSENSTFDATSPTRSAILSQASSERVGTLARTRTATSPFRTTPTQVELSNPYSP